MGVSRQQFFFGITENVRFDASGDNGDRAYAIFLSGMEYLFLILTKKKLVSIMFLRLVIFSKIPNIGYVKDIRVFEYN